MGVVAAVCAGALAAVLLAFDAPRGWRVIVFPPLWVAALGFFQARAKT